MSIAPPRGDADWEAFARIEGEAFGTTAEATARYIAAVRDHAVARFAYAGGRVVGGALAFPCQQRYGGRGVTAGAVASVCVAPEHRGRGLGREIMRSLVVAMRSAGIALAPLWPSTVGFYRALGWELAGEVRAHAVPAHMLAGTPAGGAAVRDPDAAAVRTVRDAVTAEWAGAIDLPGWWWDWRRPDPAPDLTSRFGWREGGRVTGVLTFARSRPADRPWGYDVRVSELWTATADALAGLAALLASEAPLSPTIHFDHGALPVTPDLQWRVPDVGLTVTGTNAWMLRVLDPAEALRQAGWPADVSARLALEVAGVEEGPARLEVAFADGAAEARPGGAATVRMSAGAFAAWYAGAMPASTAARLRLADGDGDGIRLMDRLVADRRPWHPDRY